MIDPYSESLLEDMLKYARTALKCVEGKDRDQFVTDEMTVLAVTRAIEIVGEAANQVKPAIQALLPTLPWQEAIGMRHKLIHGYRTVNPEIIFETVRNDFPELIIQLERVLSEGTKP